MAITYRKRNIENINKLADNTKILVMAWHEYCEANDIDILIYETIRTKATQEMYLEKGVSTTLKSYHIVGQAFDFVPVENGKTMWGKYDSPDIKKAIAEAKRLGFVWGGEWKTFVDKPHMQYEYKGYGTDTFGKTPSNTVLRLVSKLVPKKVSVPNVTLKVGSKGTYVTQLQSKLKALGYKITVDGEYGNSTKSIVTSFQKKYKLSPDGIAGKSTLTKLWNL